MTRGKAIEILSRRTTIPGDGYSYEQINEAIDIAILSLFPVSREQVERMWMGMWIDTRENSKDVPTYMCSRCTRVVVGQKHNFCPSCGAPMTDDAVDMVMEKLESVA